MASKNIPLAGAGHSISVTSNYSCTKALRTPFQNGRHRNDLRDVQRSSNTLPRLRKQRYPPAGRLQLLHLINPQAGVSTRAFALMPLVLGRDRLGPRTLAPYNELITSRDCEGSERWNEVVPAPRPCSPPWPTTRDLCRRTRTCDDSHRSPRRLFAVKIHDYQDILEVGSPINGPLPRQELPRITSQTISASALRSPEPKATTACQIA